MSTVSIRERLQQAPDLGQPVLVPTPEWAEFGVPELYVRALSGRQREAIFERQRVEVPDGVNGKGKRKTKVHVRSIGWTAAVVAAGAVDKQGVRIFEDDDADWLADKNAAALSRVADKVQELSGLSSDEQESLGEGSSATPGGASSSDSPGTSGAPAAS